MLQSICTDHPSIATVWSALTGDTVSAETELSDIINALTKIKSRCLTVLNWWCINRPTWLGWESLSAGWLRAPAGVFYLSKWINSRGLMEFFAEDWCCRCHCRTWILGNSKSLPLLSLCSSLLLCLEISSFNRIILGADCKHPVTHLWVKTKKFYSSFCSLFCSLPPLSPLLYRHSWSLFWACLMVVFSF